MEKIKINRAIIVEGKYDKIKLKSIFDCTVITLDGYKIFKDNENKKMIKQLAENEGVIILTDSDTAGFRLRSYIKSFTNNGNIINIYIPQIAGKEKRKEFASKEGTLGVEGIDSKILVDLFKQYGCISNIEDKSDKDSRCVTKEDFFDDGLMGGSNSKELRRRLSEELKLPNYMTTNSLMDIINKLISYNEYKEIIMKIKR